MLVTIDIPQKTIDELVKLDVLPENYTQEVVQDYIKHFLNSSFEGLEEDCENVDELE